MMKLGWLKGILRYRGGRLFGAIAGTAVTIALLASVGSYTSYSGATMTKRAIENVPVDWQVQLSPGSDVSMVESAIGKTTGYTDLERVGYADSPGFEASTGGTVQTTGSGKVLGISEKYFKKFPGEIRQLIGATKGVLVAQQTAANLHVQTGDTVTIQRMGLPPVQVKVDGIVDLPGSDSLFQAVGLPAGSAPQAPPDNVILLPDIQWHKFFDSQADVRPDSVRVQLHVRISHNLPADPNEAYQFVQRLKNNLEARIAGSGIVGDNLAAQLAAVREDAFYSKVLFLFLGLPGIVLAVLLTLFITASGSKHRRQEQAVLRIHGASTKQILGLQATEALLVGLGGVLLGLLLTGIIIELIFPSFFSPDKAMVIWVAASSVFGLSLAATALLYPAWRQAHASSAVGVKPVEKRTKPVVLSLYLDIVLLAISAIEFWRTASTGYKVVLAPEGVTAISVNYEAFIAPFFLWIGCILLAVRFSEGALGKGHRFIRRIIHPVSKSLSGIVSSALSRERVFIKRGIILLTLAVSFAVSTSIFNTTYNAQARVDAELTNGSDVTVTGVVPFQPDDGRLAKLKALPGIAGMELMQHRFAYVGNDLQDIYGIDASRITNATNISDAYFDSGDAKATLSALSKQSDGILVSDETVKDFQLQPGDQLNLRMQNAKDRQYHIVPFHFIGVVREFPTAPTDSFLVANKDYISKMTGGNVSEIVLMRASGSPDELAGQVRNALGSFDSKVTDISEVQKTINSSLTSVDLKGLTKIELGFAILLVAGSVGLVLALGLAERKRNFAVLLALGARESQLGGFIWSEALLMLAGGGLMGVLLGVGVAQMLVKVLTGVFDPPPQFLAIPWLYLAVLMITATISTIIAVSVIKKISRRPAVEELRKL